MKYIRLSLVVMVTVLFAVSCAEHEKSVMDEATALKTTYYTLESWDAIDFCGPVQVHELIGGQYIHMGTVAVGNDADSLYVKYEVDEGYFIAETHLFVGDVMGEDFPKGKKDNPKIGQFPYASEVSSNIVIYSIALSELDGDCFDVAAHAVVMCEDGTCEETAWGAGKVQNDVVFASKAFIIYEDDMNRSYGLTSGVLFAEDCPYSPHWGYVPVDLANFVPGTYNIASSGGTVLATVSTSIVGDKMVFTFAAEPGIMLDGQYLFAGALEDLLTYFDVDNCPEYYLFPYFSKEAVIEVPLSDLPSGSSSSESLELTSTRWGFYFKYCVDAC